MTKMLISRGEFVAGGLATLFATPRAIARTTEPEFLVEIAPGIFVHQGRHELFTPANAGDIANAAIIVGEAAIAIVDTGGSLAVGQRLRAAARAISDRPVRYVINTHMHPDHVFGNAAFAAEGAIVVGHRNLPRALAARAAHYLATNAPLLGETFAGTRILPPTLIVEDRLVLELGGRSLVLEAQPTAHTDNDLTVFDPATGTLLLGDLLFSEHVPTLDGSLSGWLALLDRLQRIEARRVVPGHGPPALPWPAALDAERRYLALLASEVKASIAQGRSIAEAAESAAWSERDRWLLFAAYHRRNVIAAFAELEWN